MYHEAVDRAASPIGWLLDLLLGGVAAMLVGSTIVMCLYLLR